MLASLICLASLIGLAFYHKYIKWNYFANLISFSQPGNTDNTLTQQQLQPEKAVSPVVTQNNNSSSTDMPDETPFPRPETGFHTAVINQVAVTNDGLLLTVSDDKTARLWPAGSIEGEPLVLRVPIGPRSEGALYTIAVSPTKNSAVVGGATGIDWDKAGSVYGLDLNTGKITGRITGIQGSIRVLAYSQDGH